MMNQSVVKYKCVFGLELQYFRPLQWDLFGNDCGSEAKIGPLQNSEHFRIARVVRPQTKVMA
eukprot:900036-Amphidinium_carterae.1